jgi:hypothetical protein
MRVLRRVSGVMFLVLLAACGGPEPASRGLAAPGQIEGSGQADRRDAPQYAVRTVTVRVPETLKVSEANLYYPIADIVWRNDPPGDRHAQVRAVFEAGLAQGTAATTSGVPVELDIEVTRFHALSQKARSSFGGTYAIHFILTVREAGSGALLDGPRHIRADLAAAGGARAAQQEAAGQTPKVLITQHIASVISQELARPIGGEAPRTAALGFWRR